MLNYENVVKIALAGDNFENETVVDAVTCAIASIMDQEGFALPNESLSKAKTLIDLVIGKQRRARLRRLRQEATARAALRHQWQLKNLYMITTAIAFVVVIIITLHM